MSADRPTRRRAIAIFAATAASLVAGRRAAQADTLHEWRGIAMGADATIRFSGIAPDAARDAVRLATAEIERLERALSLFRDESEICRLNRDGHLDGPSADFRAALRLACDVADATGGLYDPTVQPLWETHVDWFADNPARALPPDTLIGKARRLVDYRRIALSDASVRLSAGQSITLNGLGQGYVTDRVAGLLRARGLDHVLVDLGEQCALGPRESGAPWMVAREGSAPIALRDGGLATSEGSGCIFGANGKAHHLFDPHSGRSAHQWRRVTVHHRFAAVADALSTALYAAQPQQMAAIAANFPGVMVWATDQGGRERTFAAAPVHGASAAPKG